MNLNDIRKHVRCKEIKFEGQAAGYGVVECWFIVDPQQFTLHKENYHNAQERKEAWEACRYVRRMMIKALVNMLRKEQS